MDHKERAEYLEKELEYPSDVIEYLASKQDEETLQCLSIVNKFTNSPFGFQLTKHEEFIKSRRKFEFGLTKLEAQGFIVKKQLGNMRPYFITKRGIQLNDHLSSSDNE